MAKKKAAKTKAKTKASGAGPTDRVLFRPCIIMVTDDGVQCHPPTTYLHTDQTIVWFVFNRTCEPTIQVGIADFEKSPLSDKASRKKGAEAAYFPTQPSTSPIPRGEIHLIEAQAGDAPGNYRYVVSVDGSLAAVARLIVAPKP